MTDADHDNPALDAEVAARSVDRVFERSEPGVVGNTQRLGALGRTEHLDVNRAFGGRALEIGIEDVAEVARRPQCRADPVIGVEEAQEIPPHIVALAVEHAVGKLDAIARSQLARQDGRDRAFEVAVQFGLGDHAKPLSGKSGRCSQLSAA